MRKTDGRIAAPTFKIASNAGPFDLAAVSTPSFSKCSRRGVRIASMKFRSLTRSQSLCGKVAFIGISGSPYGVDGSSPENQADIDAWVQKLGVTYPIAYDPDLQIANQYLQGGYPTIVMIDSHKVVRVRQQRRAHAGRVANGPQRRSLISFLGRTAVL